MEEVACQPKRMTILHVEDDPTLAQLVRMAIESLGFRGEFFQVSLVAEAVALLAERSRQKAPLDLILVDMQLPDGNGLDIIRKVKDSLSWHLTPVIVLSAETATNLIDEAYALGANCYLPKLCRDKGILGSVQALYRCWVEGALLPKAHFVDPVQEALARGIRLRARTAQFYFDLAQSCSRDPELERFWIERSLNEGNKSNLLAFFQGQISIHDVAPHTCEQTLDMQARIEKSLERAEALLAQRVSPPPAEICDWVLALAEAADEDVLAEAFGALFPKSPTVTLALKAQAAAQLRELAGYVLKHGPEPELQRRAGALLAFAGRLAALGAPR